MLWVENVLNNLSCYGRSCEQGCAFLHNSPRCQVTAFTICNWICATMQPGLQSERKLFFHFFLGSFWGTHISIVIVARQDETCFLIQVFLINFKFVLVNTQRMQYCTMRCHCPTIQLCHNTIMQLCLLCIQPCNPSASWKITIGGCIYVKVWQQRRLSQIILKVVRLDLALKQYAWKNVGGKLWLHRYIAYH